MKYLILFLIPISLFANEYKFKCIKVHYSFDLSGIYRCENKEVVCYFGSGSDSASCFQKGKQVNKRKKK